MELELSGCDGGKVYARQLVAMVRDMRLKTFVLHLRKDHDKFSEEGMCCLLQLLLPSKTNSLRFVDMSVAPPHGLWVDTVAAMRQESWVPNVCL